MMKFNESSRRVAFCETVEGRVSMFAQSDSLEDGIKRPTFKKTAEAATSTVKEKI